MSVVQFDPDRAYRSMLEMQQMNKKFAESVTDFFRNMDYSELTEVEHKVKKKPVVVYPLTVDTIAYKVIDRLGTHCTLKKFKSVYPHLSIDEVNDLLYPFGYAYIYDGAVGDNILYALNHDRAITQYNWVKRDYENKLKDSGKPKKLIVPKRSKKVKSKSGR